MSYEFGKLNTASELLSSWWRGEEQSRPCILCSYMSDETQLNEGNSMPDAVALEQWWTDPQFRMNKTIEQITSTTYVGEAVPYHYIDFGSSAMAAILGARMEFVNNETVWAYPTFSTLDELAEIVVDVGNEYYAYLRTLTQLSAESAHDNHFVTHFALGAPGDTVAALYGTEPLLIDMIEHPDAVDRAFERMKQIWIECFTEFKGYIDASGNNGYVGWAGVWAPGPTFPMQEDFSYMISLEMYRRFCLPHVSDMVDALDCPMYHLDGIGAIPHLESLLELGSLRVIQWVPGAGHEELKQWYELIKRILDRGKSVQLFAKTEEVAPLIGDIGTRGVLISISDPTPENAAHLVEEFGLE